MSVSTGMRDRASSLGRTPSVEITWRKTSTQEAPILDLFGESFLMRRRAKKVAGCCYIMDGAVIRADCVIKIQSDFPEVSCNESYHRNELGGSAGGDSGHAVPQL